MLAIIGGTGLENLPGLVIDGELAGVTPFGLSSSPVLLGHLSQHRVLFLARHGAGHRLLPHEVNYRANIFAQGEAAVGSVAGLRAAVG